MPVVVLLVFLLLSLLRDPSSSLFPSSSSPIVVHWLGSTHPSPVFSINSAMVGSVYEVRADWGVPGLVRRRTAVSRHEPWRQERSGRSRSISRPTPRQPVEQTSQAHPSRQPSQNQYRGRQLRHPSLHPASPYDDQYASEDDHTSEDDELLEIPHVSAPEELRGRHRNPVGASAAAPLPPRYYPPAVSTLSMVPGQGQGDERDGNDGRDHGGEAPESLLRDRGRASYRREGSQRGGVGSNAGVQRARRSHSPQKFGLSSRQRPPPAEPTMKIQILVRHLFAARMPMPTIVSLGSETEKASLVSVMLLMW